MDFLGQHCCNPDPPPSSDISGHTPNNIEDEEEVEIREGIGEPLVAPSDNPVSHGGSEIPFDQSSPLLRKDMAKEVRSPLQMLEKEASMLIPA